MLYKISTFIFFDGQSFELCETLNKCDFKDMLIVTSISPVIIVGSDSKFLLQGDRA